MNIPSSERLDFQCFTEADAPALAHILAEPEVTRNITTNGSTPERCLACANKRIRWHNSTWDSHGYGVWAVRTRDAGLAPPRRLLGWCGFIPPDDDAPDPEILYAFHPDLWGRGLASEAAAHAISWLFDQTGYQGVTAVIHTASNPGSAHVTRKLGFIPNGRMPFPLFLSGAEAADEIEEYEIWRLAHGAAADIATLVLQTGFRAGQASTVSSLASAGILEQLQRSLSRRCEVENMDSGELAEKLEEAFRHGQEDAWMDCYHLGRGAWFDFARG